MIYDKLYIAIHVHQLFRDRFAKLLEIMDRYGFEVSLIGVSEYKNNFIKVQFRERKEVQEE